MKTYAAVLRVQVLSNMDGSKKSVRSMSDHNSRKRGDFRHISNAEKKNVILVGTNDSYADVATIVNEYGLIRKDSPPCNEIVVTAAAEFFSPMSEKQIMDWANANVEFFKSEFDAKGKGKIANIQLHLDEKAPHLHIAMVPVCETITKNRHGEKTVLRVNHSGVLGKPRGGYPKGTPPSETKLGVLQTTYANAMSKFGLIRGQRDRKLPDGSRLKSTAPHVFREEMTNIAKNVMVKISETPDGELVPIGQAIRAGIIQAGSETIRLSEENHKLKSQNDALNQALSDAAATLGCDNPAFLPQYCQDLVASFEKSQPNVASLFSQFAKNVAAERLESERVQKEQIAASQISTTPRRKKGERKSPQERKEARAARKAKTCPPWLIAQKHQQFNNEVSVCLQNCNAPM